MAFLRAGDIISGQEGKVTFNINGVLEEGFFIRQFEVKFDKKKVEINTLGHRGSQHKAVGWSGTGTMTVFYITSLFRRQALEYAKNGRDIYFDMVIENNDPTSGVGKQTIALYGVNLDSVVIAKVDVDNTELDEDIEFTFQGFDLLNEFGKPELGGSLNE